MIDTNEILLRLALGAVFGGIIGYERQAHGRPAGFRTQMLVCIASVLIMIVSEYYHHLGVHDSSYVRIDPGRIAAGAITGVGFLGAGVIVKMGASVQGLTTAACLWVVSAIGLALGCGLYVAASATFGLTLFSLTVLRAVESKTASLIFKYLSITAGEGCDEGYILAVLERHGADIHKTDYERDLIRDERVFRYTVAIKDNVQIKEVCDELSELDFIRKVVVRS
jgi:putative Mg2+ transporter-C (MgtC) family protein